MKRAAMNDPTKMEYVENMKVGAFHLWLAEDIDKQKLEAQLRKGKGKSTEL